MLELTDEKSKEVVKTIVDCYKYSRDHYSDFYTLCETLQTIADVEIPSEIDQKLSADHYRLVPPDMFNAINEVVTGVSGILFAADPFFKLNAQSQRTTDDSIRNATSYLKMAAEKSSLETEFTRTLYSAVKFGAGVGYVDLEHAQEMVIDNRVPVREGKEEGEAGRILTGPGFKKGRKIVYSQYNHLQLTHFFPEPARGDRSWGIYRNDVGLLDVLRDKENGAYEEVTVGELEALKDKYPPEDKQDDNATFESAVMKENFPIELLHFRGWLPVVLDENTRKVSFVDVIGTVGNRELLMQLDMNEWHYPAVDSFIMTYLLLSDQELLYPVSKTEAAMDAFFEQFFLRNQRLLNVDRLLNRQYWTDSNDETLPQYLPSEGGRIHRIPGAKHFGAIELGDVTNKAYLEVDVLKDEVRTTFGSNWWSSGEAPPRKETAYGISKLTGATDNQRRFENKVVVQTGLKQVLQRYLEFGQLFHEKMPVKMFDTGKFEMMGRSQLVGEFAVSVDVNTPFDEPVRRQEYLQSGKLWLNDPDVDQIEFKREWFRLLKFQNPERFVPDPKERTLHIEKENMMMVKTGEVYPVLPEENHLLHYKTHLPYQKYPNIAQHMQIHVAFEKQKQGGNGQGGQMPMAQNEPDLLRGVSQRLEPKNLITGR